MGLTKEDTHTILKKYLEGRRFEYVSSEEVLLRSDEPIGFLSTQSRLRVKYKIEGSLKSLNLFIKSLPKSEFRRNSTIAIDGFVKEVAVYENFLIGFKKRTSGNPVPTCYFTKDNELIIFNDLSTLGFSNVPLLETFSVDHCERAFESLAKLNSASIAFEKNHKCKIDDRIPILKTETIFRMDDNYVGRKAVKVGIKALKKIQEKCFPDYSIELTNRVFDYMDRLGAVMGPSPMYQNVLSHSDLWANNLMFSYDDSHTAKECCILDFQIATIQPITFDLLMLIHLCTSRELRDAKYDHFVKYYYDQLAENLNSRHISISEVLPWSSYEGVLSETRPMILALAPQYLHFVLMPDFIIRDVLADDDKFKYYYEVDRSEYALKATEECKEYRKRITDGLREVFDYFILNNK